jgi:hypothetical protein
LFADKNVGFVCYCKTAINAVVIGDGDKIHPTLAQFRIELGRFSAAIWEIESPEQPFLRSRTELRVNVEVAPAHTVF